MTLLFDPSNMKIMITNNKRFTYLLSYEQIPLLQTIRSFYEPHQSMKIDASIQCLCTNSDLLMTSSPLRHCRRCRLLGLFRTHLHESVVGEPHQQPQPPRNHGQMYFCHPMNFYFFTSPRKQQFLLVHRALRQEKRLRLQMRVKAVGNLVMSSNWSVIVYE